MNATTTSTTSQPATPTIAKPTRSTLDQRQDMGTGIPMTFASSKAQDLPPYEEMIFMAIADLKQEAGSAPKAILDWVQDAFQDMVDLLGCDLNPTPLVSH
ncbi:hypothetical protein BGW38_003846 [Lunasporangiospora selenospora]|uniref:Histone H1 n=1 Tax=Lunasporangiospora selenospora TaxID=979761 RepID=A0A9P6G2G0_9FUNG|nr:hypothetical protein BGW38_003846 [Lunasporangiospora selenospora]